MATDNLNSNNNSSNSTDSNRRNNTPLNRLVTLSYSHHHLQDCVQQYPTDHILIDFSLVAPFHSSLLTFNSLFLCVLQQAYSGYPAQAQQAPIAKPAAASVWSEHKTDDGNTYWYNASTGVSQVCDKASCRAFMKCLGSLIICYVEITYMTFHLYPNSIVNSLVLFSLHQPNLVHLSGNALSMRKMSTQLALADILFFFGINFIVALCCVGDWGLPYVHITPQH